MVRSPPLRWLAGPLALAILAGCSAWHALMAQERAASPRAAPPPRQWWDPPAATPQSAPTPTADIIYRLKRDQPGDAKPIVLDADEIVSWTESSGGAQYCVFLMRGLVLAQQGIAQARCQQAVAWIDLGTYKVTGKLHAEVYLEGGVRIDDGSRDHTPPRAVLDWTTRGELRLRLHRQHLKQETHADDPLVQRGRAEGMGPLALRPRAPTPPSPSPVQPASYQPRELILPPTVSRSTPPQPAQVPAPSPLPQPPPPPKGGASPLPPRSSAAPAGTTERIAYYYPPMDPDTGSAASPGTPPGLPPFVPTAQPGAGPQPPQSDGPASGGLPAPVSPVPPSGPSQIPPGTPPLPPPSIPMFPPPGRQQSPARNFMVAPRQGGSFALNRKTVGPNGESMWIITGGVMLQVRNAPNVGMVDMEADRIVIWTQGGEGERLGSDIQRPAGYTSNDLEVYLSGHVIVRQSPMVNVKNEQRTISADEVYYDVSRNVAIALNAKMELKQPMLLDPIMAVTRELRQTSLNTFEVDRAEVFSSKLPSDPGLKMYLRDGVIEDKSIPLKNIFGGTAIDRKTGQPVMVRQTLLTGNNAFFELEKVPFFYLPSVSTTAQEPLGPVQDFNFGFSRIYGAQLGVTLNAYQLLGLQPQPNTSWAFNVDYLSYRGPGLGTSYNWSGTEFFGVPGKYTALIKGFGMDDRNYDILGGLRPVNNFQPNNFRGWAPWRFTGEEMPYGFSVLGQIVGVSDRNFIEQYYKRVWDMDPNQDTFLFGKWQNDNYSISGIVEPRLRRWVTMTQNLPRFDGWLIGQSFFNAITYSTHANLEYASLRTSTDPLPQVSVTDVPTNTGRASWMQEAQVPFYLGPLKLLPYARAELTGYTNDVYGNPIFRPWEAGGVRADLPLTHLYPTVQSELFNVNGLNHKMVLAANYIFAYTNVPYTNLPQLDRLNDDATNQMLRDIRPYQFIFNPLGVFDNHGLSLVGSPYFNTPQTYAIRSLLFDRIDTLNSVTELQLDLRQRLQTKRGFPGNQHIVDWMTLDTQATYFPDAQRDNFGHPWAFLRYNYLWNIGDRTAFESTGWSDPFAGGVKMWTIGGYFNRPPRTNIYLGFREIDPLNVRAATISMTYVFSPKYAATLSGTYDFGNLVTWESLMFTRMGSDIQVSLGFTFNSLQNNFGLIFNIIPNLLPANRAFGPMSSSGAGSGVLK